MTNERLYMVISLTIAHRPTEHTRNECNSELIIIKLMIHYIINNTYTEYVAIHTDLIRLST